MCDGGWEWWTCGRCTIILFSSSWRTTNKLQLVLIYVLNRQMSEHCSYTRYCIDAFKAWLDLYWSIHCFVAAESKGWNGLKSEPNLLKLGVINYGVLCYETRCTGSFPGVTDDQALAIFTRTRFLTFPSHFLPLSSRVSPAAFTPPPVSDATCSIQLRGLVTRCKPRSRSRHIRAAVRISVQLKVYIWKYFGRSVVVIACDAVLCLVVSLFTLLIFRFMWNFSK